MVYNENKIPVTRPITVYAFSQTGYEKVAPSGQFEVERTVLVA